MWTGHLIHTMITIVFFIKDKFSINTGNGDMKPIDCIYIPGDNLLPYDTYCLVFKGDHLNKSIDFVINAKEIGLDTRFKIKKKNLRKIPDLKF